MDHARLPCACAECPHEGHLRVQEGHRPEREGEHVRSEWAEVVVMLCSMVANFFQDSGTAKAKLNEAQVTEYGARGTIVVPAPTRWALNHFVVKCILENKRRCRHVCALKAGPRGLAVMPCSLQSSSQTLLRTPGSVSAMHSSRSISGRRSLCGALSAILRCHSPDRSRLANDVTSLANAAEPEGTRFCFHRKAQRRKWHHRQAAGVLHVSKVVSPKERLCAKFT